MSDLQNRNQKIIDEFRANDGQVGGQFAGAPMVLLHHLGRRSGTPRINPMMYQSVGENYAVFASKGGAPDNPDWYRNLLAHPDTTIEIGTRTVSVHARDLPSSERDPIWEQQKKDYPGFADYEAKTSRTIPVVLLEVTG